MSADLQVAGRPISCRTDPLVQACPGTLISLVWDAVVACRSAEGRRPGSVILALLGGHGSETVIYGSKVYVVVRRV